MAQHEQIIVERRDGYALITLNRPDHFNAYTTRMGVELFGSIAELDGEDAVRAIVITGAGKHFCAGADLESGGDTFAESDFSDAATFEDRTRPWNLSTPIIAAFNGAAVGVGATLPLSWDLRIASERAKLGFVFTRRGIIPEANSTWLLPRLVGMATALDLLLTGRMVLAAEALELGLVSRVVPPDELLSTAEQMARDIAKNTAPVSVAITKRLAWRQLMQNDAAECKRLEDELFYWSGKQADAAEGVNAFLEKREPAWKLSKTGDLPEQVK